MQQQQGDVILYQTVDDGEIDVVDGIVSMDGGLQTSFYLSLFGGNEDDDGGSDRRNQWWGNLTETEPEKKQISRTQNILSLLPATSSNLRKVEEAAKIDTKWSTDIGLANSVDVVVSIPELNKVKIAFDISADGASESFEFIENWRASE